MLIVADTNTVLSGLLWQGPPRRLIDLARARVITLCTSSILVAELAEVIGRGKFAQRVRAAGLSAAELVQDYRRLAQLIEPQPLPTPISRDTDDDHVLACALAAQVEFIVSGDADLLDLKTTKGCGSSPLPRGNPACRSGVGRASSPTFLKRVGLEARPTRLDFPSPARGVR